jgi:hypothetical protein
MRYSLERKNAIPHQRTLLHFELESAYKLLIII